MNHRRTFVYIIAGVVLVGFCVACALTGSVMSPAGTLWSVLPPIIAITLALLTKETVLSLMVGILSGALLACNFKPIDTLGTVVYYGFIQAVIDNVGIYIFLIFLGIIVSVLSSSGGTRAFRAWAERHIHSRTGATLGTIFFGILMFIDDYFNCLTVGSVMRPITDQQKISRAKLAFIIDATAAPICMIAPVSSWAAAVSGYAPEGQGLNLFCAAIPYNFYSLLTIVFMISITLMRFDYGPMRKFENNAIKGDVFSDEGDRQKYENSEKKRQEKSSEDKILHLIFPVASLIVCCIFALYYIGACYRPGVELDINNFDPSVSFVDAIANTKAQIALPIGGFLALILTFIYAMIRRVLPFKTFMECIPNGFSAMVPAIIILTLATSLKNMTGLLDSSAFVSKSLANAKYLYNFLPAIIFAFAAVNAFATGSSWGTFGILIPITLAIFPAGTEIGLISMSACLAGSVCGDHCSPISDTTIMASTGAMCRHLNHVSTQLPYAGTIAAVAFVGYIMAGFIQDWRIVLPISAALLVAVLFVIRAAVKKKSV